MKTRRTLLFCFAILALLFVLPAFPAGADGGVVNPYQSEVWEMERYRQEYKAPVPEGGLEPNATGAPVTLKQKKAPVLDGSGTWSISVGSGYGTPLEAIVYLSMKDYSSSYTTIWRKEYSSCPSQVSCCKIVSGGEYELAVFVKTTTTGNGYWLGSVRFTIKDDASHTSLTEKVDEVVRQCTASSKWQTAVNLHDWLVTHVYYDLTYSYYGADMILRGYGVCDGYSKAFLMMCKQAGISVYRVTNANHAWNVLKLDGEWYFIDCTWDDPAGQSEAVSGQESKEYFCLNTELLALDHPTPWDFTNTSAKTCTALDDNYFVRKKDWNAMGNRKTDGSTYSAAMAAQISANGGGNYIPIDSFFYLSGNYGYDVTGSLNTTVIRRWKLLACAIGKESLEIPGFGPVDLDVWFREDDRCFVYAVRGYAEEDTGTLAIPAGVTEIQKEAFASVSASTIRIPDKCTKIGPYAFRDSGVKRIYIPASVTSIDETAFSGCGRMMILCPGGSAACNFAVQHGILWHYP